MQHRQGLSTLLFSSDVYRFLHNPAVLDSNVDSPSPSGSVDSQSPAQNTFLPWQPTTWPKAPRTFAPLFYNTVETIFSETIIQEISNVINDIQSSNETGLKHRGHVVAIVLLCAIDAIASYAYSNIMG